MTKEYVIEVSKGNNKGTKNEMSTLDKIIVLWFFTNLIKLMILSFKRIIKK